NNTAACDDGDACTTADTCAGGICMGGAPRDCDDLNVCTDDSCDPVSGCINTDNTGTCDDGDLCTVLDTCSGGVCVAGDSRDVSFAKINAVIKDGPADDRMIIKTTVASSDVGVLPDVGGLEVMVVRSDGSALYAARVEAVDFVNAGGKGTRFKYKDKTKSRPDKLFVATVKMVAKKGIAKVKVKTIGMEFPDITVQPSLSASVIFGDASSGDCLTAFQAGCKPNSKGTKVKCLLRQ
ncbi:MAG: hypothetical protein ACE5E4_13345, partial [Candidatus Binatia bacterium]